MADFSEEEPTGAKLPGFGVGASQARPTLTLDVSLYEEFFAGSDLSEIQKRELLEALWQIVVGFVDLGFRVETREQTTSDNSDAECGAFERAVGAIDVDDFQNGKNRNRSSGDRDSSCVSLEIPSRKKLATDGRSMIESAVHSSIQSFDKAAGRGSESGGA